MDGVVDNPVAHRRHGDEAGLGVADELEPVRPRGVAAARQRPREPHHGPLGVHVEGQHRRAPALAAPEAPPRGPHVLHRHDPLEEAAYAAHG